MKKTHFAVIASVLGVAIVMLSSRFFRAHAGFTGIPLSQLAGSFAGESEAHYGLCLNSNFSALQSCSTTPASQVVPWNDSAANQFTSDGQGNSCDSEFEANAPVFPGPEPAGVNHYILVGVTNSYNPTTGSGNGTIQGYFAKSGVGCQGATFVNTANETALFTAKFHVVVSQNGKRSDSVVLTIHTTSPVDFISGFVEHGFALRQTNTE